MWNESPPCSTTSLQSISNGRLQCTVGCWPATNLHLSSHAASHREQISRPCLCHALSWKSRPAQTCTAFWLLQEVVERLHEQRERIKFGSAHSVSAAASAPGLHLFSPCLAAG